MSTESIVGKKPLAKNIGFIQHSLAHEKYREYDFNGRIYRIDAPKTLFIRKGGETHRVVDQENVVHCVPAPGQQGCVLRWFTGNSANVVQF